MQKSFPRNVTNVWRRRGASWKSIMSQSCSVVFFWENRFRGRKNPIAPWWTQCRPPSNYYLFLDHSLILAYRTRRNQMLTLFNRRSHHWKTKLGKNQRAFPVFSGKQKKIRWNQLGQSQNQSNSVFNRNGSSKKRPHVSADTPAETKQLRVIFRVQSRCAFRDMMDHFFDTSGVTATCGKNDTSFSTVQRLLLVRMFSETKSHGNRAGSRLPGSQRWANHRTKVKKTKNKKKTLSHDHLACLPGPSWPFWGADNLLWHQK